MSESVDRRRPERGFFGRLLDFFSSYGLAVFLLLMLLVLTYFGTLEQVRFGLHAVQKKYFESLFLVHWIGDTIPVLLPGVFLLLVLLSVNLVLGGIVRMRRSVSLIGVYVVHAGILLLFASSLVTFLAKEEGQLAMYEGEESAEFVALYDWEVAIFPVVDGERTEQVISMEELGGVIDGKSVRFTSAALPFDLELSRWLSNCRPTRIRREHVVLDPLPLEKEAGNNAAGAVARVIHKSGGREDTGILYAAPNPPFDQEVWPFVVESDGRRWGIDLRRTRMDLPFGIRLIDFRHEFHPGTGIPKLYESVVEKISDDSTQLVKIEMNEPLRAEGYTLYQSSYGPQRNVRPGEPFYSVFTVARNPTDQGPLLACVVICGGLLLHFGMKLTRYLRSEARRRAA